MLRTIAAFLLSILLLSPITGHAQEDVGAIEGQQSVPDEVRFVIMGDSQFGNKGLFERLIHEVNLLRPHFVTQVGDLIQGYTHDEEQLREEWELYQAQIEPLTMPFFPVPGNHDVVTPESEKVYGEVWGNDRYVYSFDHGPVHCIVLDTYYQEQDERIAEWQRDWLKKNLQQFAEENGGLGSEELKKKSIFVLMHAPLWRYSKSEEGRQDWDEIHEMLTNYPVRLVVGGHTHEYVWENRDGIDYVVINSSGGMSQENERGGMFHSYLHVSVKEGNDVRVAVLKPGSILPLDTVNSEERSAIPRYSLKGGTVRVPDWETGGELDTTISLPVTNKLEKPRVYRLDWHTPRGAGVTIEPSGMWLEVPPGETAQAEFHITSPSAPAEENRPWLEVSTEQKLRSGVVPREWEKVYRERKAAAKEGKDVTVTNIPLEENIRYTARFDIFVPPVANAIRREGSVTLDARLNEEAWQNAPVEDEFVKVDGSPTEVETEVRFLYDDDYLYVGAWMEEPNPDALTDTAEGLIALTWSDDDLELFFDPQKTQSEYTRLFQNSFGTRFNSLPRHLDDKYFRSDYKSDVRIGKDHWVLEMQIPWDEMSAEEPPEQGDTWHINIGRNRQQSDPVRSAWSEMNGQGLYDPTRYGVLEFE